MDIKSEIDIKLEPFEFKDQNLNVEKDFAIKDEPKFYDKDLWHDNDSNYDPLMHQIKVKNETCKDISELCHSESIKTEDEENEDLLEQFSDNYKVKIENVETNIENIFKEHIAIKKFSVGTNSNFENPYSSAADTETLFYQLENSEFPKVALKKLNVGSKETNFKNALNVSNRIENFILYKDTNNTLKKHYKRDHSASDMIIDANSATGQLENCHRIGSSSECNKGIIKETQTTEILSIFNPVSRKHLRSLESSNSKPIIVKKMEFTQLYKCSECNYNTLQKSQLLFHIKSHESKKSIKVGEGNHNTEKKTRQNSNKRCCKIQTEKIFKCVECDFSSKRKTDFEHHLRIHTGGKPLKCNVFDYSASQRSSLKCHKRIHTEEKPFKCSNCDFNTNYKSYLQKHIRIHTVEKPFKCSYCDYSASQKQHLKLHTMNHTGEKPFKCNDCDYKAKDKSTFQTHLRIHADEKPFKCSYCDYSASRMQHLKSHTMNHTGEKPFKCNDCDYKAKNKSVLQTHLRIHTGEKTFKCSYCDFSASQIQSLKRHIMVHTEEKPFKCSNCDFKTNYKSDFQRHIRIHTGEKPFKCNDCDYKANNKKALRTHLRIHTGEKPFKCSVCDYSASQRSSLKTHIWIHTEEKPFKCNDCNYKGRNKSALRIHLRIHTGEKPFKCIDCNYSASRMQNLKRHKIIHTKEK